MSIYCFVKVNKSVIFAGKDDAAESKVKRKPVIYESSSEEEEEEEEEEEAEEEIKLKKHINYDGERKRVSEIDFDSFVALPTTSTISEQDQCNTADNQENHSV